MLHDILGNRYVPSGLLGVGGMAKVFLAHDRILGRDVALKVLRGQYAEDAEFVERFRREATSVATLNHPNVVQVYDQGRSEDGRYYIAMEYVPGGTLKDRIDGEGTLDPAEAARLASQVAQALQAAHERGIVHRDVKPHNVLLTAAGDAKVADFGIARAASVTAISRTSLVLGTASYMSPEQAMGEPVGPASDLYSLGVVLYEMLTGGVPFGAESPVAVAIKHVTEPPRPPRELNPVVPEQMDTLMMGLLTKKPEGRPGSAVELAEDLRRAREGLPLAFVGAAGRAETVRNPAVGAAPVTGSTGGAHLSSPRTEPIRRKPIRRKPIRVTVAALVVLLALLGAFGWDLSRTPEGGGAVQAVEGGPLEAPATVSGARAADGGKGAGSNSSSAGLAGGASVSSASASVPASAPSAPSASEPPPPPAPSSASPVLEGFPAPGDPDRGAGDSGGGRVPADDQYE